MTETVRTRVREILMVQDDGSLVWNIHQKKIVEILDGEGNITDATYRAPTVLSADDLPGVLDVVFIDLTHERDAANVAKGAAEAALIDMTNDRDQRVAEVAQLTASLEAAVAAGEAVTADRDAKMAAFTAERELRATEIVGLQAQVAGLQLLLANQTSPVA
ncbi:hypothetical protein [Sphingomonas sp. SRS2]|uniref:hypothetical protein n=1 Tax=Sphingomonas sp. SRS2 TaxID=133190 RepID=UPI000ABA2057|nr:hypothetical protein [Sphingomonas sp. SRS2]